MCHDAGACRNTVRGVPDSSIFWLNPWCAKCWTISDSGSTRFNFMQTIETHDSYRRLNKSTQNRSAYVSAFWNCGILPARNLIVTRILPYEWQHGRYHAEHETFSRFDGKQSANKRFRLKSNGPARMFRPLARLKIQQGR